MKQIMKIESADNNKVNDPETINELPDTTFCNDQIDMVIDSLHVSIDRICLSMIITTLNKIDKSLKDFCRVVSDKAVLYKNGRFDKLKRVRVYSSDNNKTISVQYSTYHDKKDTQRLFIIIDEPDYLIQEQMQILFEKLEIKPCLNKIEIALDFYSGQRYQLKEFIEHHGAVPYSRQECGRCKDTFYSGNLRKASKGFRLYMKQVEGKEFLRLELELHRTIIKNDNLLFPLYPDQLDALILKKYFRFKRIDSSKLLKYEKKRYWKEISKINRRATHPLRRNPGALYLRHMESYWRCLDTLPHIEKVKWIKAAEIPNSYRFVAPMHVEDILLEGMVEKCGFIM